MKKLNLWNKILVHLKKLKLIDRHNEISSFENRKNTNVYGNIVYRQQTFITRLVDCGVHGTVTVAKKDLEEAIREGFFNCDGEAIEIDETISYYCDNAEFLYADRILENIIFD
ncbi:MAG: hypothetical protein LUD40_03170 [Phocaeicola dorei]|nr:hypothetical protein [Phocaeicola dorei]